MGLDIEELLPSSASNKKSVEYYLKKRYEKIFKTLFTNNDKDLKEYTCTDEFPKFTERNLTVNFAEAVKNRYPGSVCWYEFSFQAEEDAKSEKEKDNEHFDAVIVSPNEDLFVLICEAKRNYPESGFVKIEDDIQRIQKYGRSIGEAVSNGGKYSYFGVILLDGWDDKNIVRLRDKRGIKHLSLWEEDNLHLIKKLFTGEILNSIINNPEKHAEFHISFNDVEQENAIHKTIREQYTIKVIVWEIQAGK